MEENLSEESFKESTRSSVKFSNKSKSYVNELKKNSIGLPLILLIFYAIPVNMSISVCQGIILRLFSTCSESHVILKYPHLTEWLQSVVIFCLHPIAGWVTDTKIGRNRTITMSLWFCWCGTILQVVSYCIQYRGLNDNCDLYVPLNQVARYFISVIALVLLILGISGYQSNILAYGMDQLPDASTNQVRKFVRWLTWSFFMGFFFDYLSILNALTSRTEELVLGTCFATFLFVSVALILHSFLRHKFYSSGTVKRNPYTTVAKVLKYAWNHKRPKNRSALTYWENKIPSRIDLGKDKYGGPFTEDDVEDTKTFWRMVAVFCSLGGVFIPYFTIGPQGAYYGFQFINPNMVEHGYIAYALWQVFYHIGVLFLPLLDVIILPLFPKVQYFSFSSFKGFLVAMGSLLIALGGMMILEGVAVYGNNTSTSYINDSTCYLTIKVLRDSEYLNVSYFYFIIPWLFVGIAYLFTLLKSFEFICSQAPNEMSGMLTGVYWFIRAFYISVGVIITYGLYNIKIFNDSLFECPFWVIVLQFCLCVVFTVVFALVTKWYRKREREQEFPYRRIVENYYDRYVNPDYNTGPVNTSELFSKYDLPVNGWSDSTIPIYPSLNFN